MTETVPKIIKVLIFDICFKNKREGNVLHKHMGNKFPQPLVMKILDDTEKKMKSRV